MHDTDALINWLKKNTGNPITEEMDITQRFSMLPLPMQRYLKFSLPNGPRSYGLLEMEQSGEIRSGGMGGWRSLEAQIYYSLPRPGYIRIEKSKFLSLLPVCTQDSYLAGEANILIHVLGRLPYRNLSNSQLDRAGMVRYLTEAAWFPEFFFLPEPMLKWEVIDEIHTRAVFQDGKNSVSVVFTINPKGEISKAETWDLVNSRLRSFQRWTAHYSDYREIDGARIPTDFSAEWKSGDSPSPCLNLRMTGIRLA